MLDRLPEFVDPVSFAEKRRQLVGKYNVVDLKRLHDNLFKTDGIVDVEFVFGKSGRQLVLEGAICTELFLVCQNCLSGLHKPIEIRFKLALVFSEDQLNKLSLDYEPLLISDEKLSLKSVVEDEILLVLPDFPKHETCHGVDHVLQSSVEIDNEQKRESPFSVLADFKVSKEDK